jgi:hypothetical protein
MRTTPVQTSGGKMNRRSFVTRTAVASAAIAWSPLSDRLSRAAENQPRGFRFVFMPCIHLRRDLRSPEGFASALQAVRKLSPAPDFILTGGDMCHNMRDQTLEQSEDHRSLPQHLQRELRAANPPLPGQPRSRRVEQGCRGGKRSALRQEPDRKSLE